MVEVLMDGTHLVMVNRWMMMDRWKDGDDCDDDGRGDDDDDDRVDDDDDDRIDDDDGCDDDDDSDGE